MKKIKGLLLVLFCGFLGLINFSSAGSFTYTGSVNSSYSASANTSPGTSDLFYLPVPAIQTLNTIINTQVDQVECTFTNLSMNLTLIDFVSQIQYSVSNNSKNLSAIQFINDSNNPNLLSNGNYIRTIPSNINTQGILNRFVFMVVYNRPNNAGTITFDYECTISGDNIIDQSSIGSSCPTIDQNYCTSNNLCPSCPSCDNSCSPSGSCSVSDKINDNLLYTGSVNLNSSSYTNIFNYGTNGAGTYCVKLTSSSPQTLSFGFANGGTTAPTNLYSLYNDQYDNWVCLYGNKAYFNAKLNSSSNSVNYEVYKLTDLLNDDIPCTTPSCDYSDYILISDVTQNYCTNRYSNLIPESDITSSYCEVEFGLIDPENCPASGGTGDVQWSSFWVNSHQIQGASNIYLFLPDFLDWDYTYLSNGSTLEIDVDNPGDQDYINGILQVQTYHPSSEDFTQSFTGTLVLLIPYIIGVGFILLIWGLIRKIFK